MESLENNFCKDEVLVIEAEWIENKLPIKYYVLSIICIVLHIIFPINLFFIWISSVWINISISEIIALPLLIIAIVKTIVNINIKNANLILTNKKISGRFGKKIMDAPINKINSIAIEQNFFGRKNGYYKLMISTSSGGYKFNYIKNADTFRNAAMEQIDIYENEKSLRQAEQMAEAMKK